MNWTKLRYMVLITGALAFSFSSGLWVQSAHDGAAALPWLHQQAAQVKPLVAKLKNENEKEAKLHCERDLAVATTNVMMNGESHTVIHCPPGVKPDRLEGP